MLLYRDFPFPYDSKIFITLPEDEAYRRRQVRTYVPADPDGFFAECIWPMYLKNKEEMSREGPDIGETI